MTKGTYGEIEIGLYRSQAETYEVELRVSDPGSEGEIAPVRGHAPISRDDLAGLVLNPAEYGRTLCAQLLKDPAVREFYIRNKTAFDSRGLLLRIRLLIGPGAPELQALRWELLTDPESGFPISVSERCLFSRFMLSRDWRVVKLRPKASLKALIAVAAPANSSDWGLALVDKAGEIVRARESLGEIPAKLIGQDEPMTLDRLVAGMREGVDVLYLVCHGAIPPGQEPCLYLQNGEGKTAVVAASTLAQRIAELPEAPRLIVLASCESAGSSGSEAHPALAPRLAEAGVPAVMAMQGKISMATVKLAMPVFFRELTKDGQIDRAMAVARGVVRDRPDYWMPALFLRLKAGRIWYEPGFGGEAAGEFEKWKSICAQVRKGQFIPILGPELGEDLFGGTRELASRLADEHAFPLEPHDRTDLAKVTQFISTNQTRGYALEAVQAQFVRQMVERLGGTANGAPQSLPALLDQAITRCRENPDHPYRLLADLPAAIFVNSSYTPMVARALRAAGKTPEPVFTSWRVTARATTANGGDGPEVPRRPQPKNAVPTADTPWVYHTFGGFAKPDMMVLTEDDFFDFLIATSRLQLLLPSLVGRLMQSSLLFLGFRLDDWRFRVLFRMIVTSEGNETMKNLSHVGVQVNPDEQSLADAERARRYMESYFKGAGDGPQVSIFWGTAADFLKQLRQRLEETRDEAPAVVQESADDWL